MNESPPKITLSTQEYADLCARPLSAFGLDDDLIVMVKDSLYWCDSPRHYLAWSQYAAHLP